MAKLDTVIGHEQGRIRPVLVVQNDISNEYSPTTIIAPISSKIYLKEYPTNVKIEQSETKLKVNSTILLNQIRTIDKSRIIKKIATLEKDLIIKVNLAIKISLGLD